MINLLPPEEKRQLRAAHTNTLLVRYNFFLLSAVAFLGLAVGITYLYLTSTKAAADQQISDAQVETGGYAETQAEAQQFRSNLATAKQILDREVTYTNVIITIAHLMPNGVVLELLNLDAEAFGTETTLLASAKDYDRALAFKDAFQNSPLFSDVHFQSVETSTNPDYPIAVSLNVTISPEVKNQ
jgi:hypothetical protein